MHRRTALSALLLAGGGVVGLGLTRPWERVWSAAAPPRPAAFVNICAHPDDDLYFLNPDVMQALDGGNAVTSVYLTAGEANGINAPLDERGPKPDFEGYAAARQYGIRSAYAAMATGNPDSPWRREVRHVGDAVYETATLAAAPHVTLAFLNLRAPVSGGGANRLEWLWDGRRDAQPYLRPTDSPLPAAGQLTRAEVFAILASLLDTAEPTVVRTLDPAPEHLKYAEGHVDYSDHTDHLYAAWFAFEAVRRHRRAGEAVQVQSYRGYFNKYWPRNLSPAVYERKFSYLDVYGWADGHACAAPYGCGDLQVGTRSRAKRYGRSQTYRHPGSTTWLVPSGDGLAAYAVFGGTALRWRRGADPGDWSAPEPVGGENLLPHLSAVSTPDGRVHLFGVRQDLAVAGPRLAVMHGEPSGGTVTWAELGNPDAGDDPVRAREVGMPVAVADADGGLSVFVRDFDRGVAMRARTADGRWGPWLRLGGKGVRDALVAVSAGPRTEVYAVTDDELLCWRRDSPAGRFGEPQVVLRGVMDGALSAARTATGGDGPVLVGHADGATLTVLQAGVGTTVPAGGGTGAVAGLLRDGRLRLLRRDDAGRVGITGAHRPGEAAAWSASGELFTGAPAVAVDSRGRACAATVGADGRLWTCALDTAKEIRWQGAPAPGTLRQAQA
ncbi:PIG-L family deacetylase [Catellatospora vulcania]|uniref:PIG-L family deacetylase n=1 Tax=Catellatospora vulcania TaxID=1460450 RepID=UPI0012D3FBC7|nr:PIG-L family deacetylase [Catellatospora vulcania]